jgi:1-deoxy-D-xylulose-5-phosphate synthase
MHGEFRVSMQTLAKPTTTFLDAVITPTELKKLSLEELNSLSQEIRQEIVVNLAKTGGHLASNLGVVEITIALHKVFNSPKDLILWDVGHQAYVHKMLTGRRHKFNSLRQFKGLSGFISPFESEHDAFIAGHSSTSISLAVGMVLARDHLKQERKVIAVIGDGGLTGGMALEAINHLGHIQKDVIIILNDNEMSISENVGGFSQYMKRIRETFFYKDIKQKIDFIEDKLDQANLNPAVKDLIQLVKKEAKDRFDTPGIVFEKLGVNYSGPIDGHDLGAVMRSLNAVKDKSTPQIIHIITRKGKGYAPAEADAIKYHGVPAFALEPALAEKAEPSVVSVMPKPKSYSDVFTEALIDIARIEPNMVAITPATAEGSGLVKFGKAFPDRFFDVAICEQHAVTMAAGMAKLGVKPVVSIYSTFLQRAMDQVIHDVAIMNLPVVFGIDRGGLVEDGETHQGVFDIAFLRAVPNFTVLAPKDARELRNMLYTALKESRGPVAIRFPREKAVNAHEIKDPSDFELIDLSKWQVLSPGLPGNGVLLAFGAMVETAVQCLPELSRLGLEPMVVAARSAKPLDEKLLQTILSDPLSRVVTMEEGQAAGGFGAAVMEYRSSMKVASPSSKLADVVTLGIPDKFVEHGARQILLDQAGLSPARVTQFLLSFLGPVSSAQADFANPSV